MKFAVKSKKAVLWKSGFLLDEVRQKFPPETHGKDWVICPLGESDKAISIEKFFENPKLWERVNPYTTGETDPSTRLSANEFFLLKKIESTHRWVIYIAVVVSIFLALLAFLFLIVIAGSRG